MQTPSATPRASIPGIHFQVLRRSDAPRPSEDQRLSTESSKMHGRAVGVGDGVQRAETRSLGKKIALGVLLSPLAVVGALPAGLVWGAVRLHRWYDAKYAQPKAERAYRQNNQELIKAWGPGADIGGDLSMDSLLRKKGPLSKTGVLPKLLEHIKVTEQDLNIRELVELVAIGERLAKEIRAGDETFSSPFIAKTGMAEYASFSSPLIPKTDRAETIAVCANAYTTRALAWYLMAEAASRDVDVDFAMELKPITGPSSYQNMENPAGLTVDDPGNRLFKFLTASPTCRKRVNSDFDELYKWPAGAKHSHQEIRDNPRKFPGQGGTMAFNKLAGGKLHVYFEPPNRGLDELAFSSANTTPRDSERRKTDEMLLATGATRPVRTLSWSMADEDQPPTTRSSSSSSSSFDTSSSSSSSSFDTSSSSSSSPFNTSSSSSSSSFDTSSSSSSSPFNTSSSSSSSSFDASSSSSVTAAAVTIASPESRARRSAFLDSVRPVTDHIHQQIKFTEQIPPTGLSPFNAQKFVSVVMAAGTALRAYEDNEKAPEPIEGIDLVGDMTGVLQRSLNIFLNPNNGFINLKKLQKSRAMTPEALDELVTGLSFLNARVALGYVPSSKAIS